MQPPPIEPGHPIEQAARRWPGIVFLLLGAFLALVEVGLIHGGWNKWAVTAGIVVLSVVLGGALKRRLGIEAEDETEGNELS